MVTKNTAILESLLSQGGSDESMVTNNTAILESLLSQGGYDESPGYKQYSYIREPTEPRWS